jgi:hypothetical protein
MVLLPYGFQNQRLVLCEVIRDIEKELAELNFQKIVLNNAFNSLNSKEDDLLENTSILNEETKKILQTKNLNRK